jgi:DNA-binding transcriptional LysR family regulator
MRHDLQTLRAFLAIADEGSISRAAARESIVPSALSKRVAELEDACGTPLLLRHRRGVELTQAGLALVAHARRVVDELRSLDVSLGEFKSGVRGHVRLLANTSAISQFLPGDIAGFLAHHPTVKIDLEERTSAEIHARVLAGAADLGIMVGDLPADGLVCRPYRNDELCVMLPHGHPLLARRKVRFADTLAYDHVGLPRGSALCEMLIDAAQACGQPLKLRIQSTGYDGLRRMVSSNLGIGILPSGSVLPYLAADGIEARPLAEPWARRQLVLVSRVRSSLTQVARRLADHLERGDAPRARASA